MLMDRTYYAASVQSTYHSVIHRDHSFPRQILPNFTAQFAILRGSESNFPHIAINFLRPRILPNMQHLSPVIYRNWQIQALYQMSWQYFR